MLNAAVCRRVSLIRARGYLVCSEAASRINGDLQTALRDCGLLEFSDGRSCIANFSKPTSFKSIVEAPLSRYQGAYSSNSLGSPSRPNTYICHFRCFCIHALDQHVQAQQDALDAAQAKVSEEADEENGENVAAAAASFQDACRKNDVALQAFDAMVNSLKASGKDADINSLESLEPLLAQVDLSAITDKHRIGAAFSKLAELYSAANQPVKSLLYAQKGFELLRRIKDLSAKYAACRCLYAIATAHCNKGEFEKSLKQAEHLHLILRHLEKSSRMKDYTPLKCAIQAVLIKCKMSLGRHEEALPHFDKYVKLKEKLVDRDDPSLGAVYIQAAEAFQEADHSVEAVNFAMKALDIHTKTFGPSSYQVGYVRSLLAEAYFELGLFEECLSEYDKARPILETVEGNSMESLAPFIMKSVFSLIELRRYESAITRLEELIRTTSKSSIAHASALVTLAKVYSLSNMKKQFFECCHKALDLLESNQLFSITTGECFCSLASAYEIQKHHEEAIMLYNKALSIFNQCPGDEAALKAADTEGEIGVALLRLQKLSQAAPYLKNYILKNKSMNALDNTRLMAVHNRVGAEYLQIGRINEALEHLESAKLLLPSDLTEIDDAIILSLYQNLAAVYRDVGRLEEALECQKMALDTAMNSNLEEIKSLTEEIQKCLETLLQRQTEITGEEQTEIIGKCDSKM